MLVNSNACVLRSIKQEEKKKEKQTHTHNNNNNNSDKNARTLNWDRIE